MQEINEPTYVLPQQASGPQGAVSIPLPRAEEFNANTVGKPVAPRIVKRQVSEPEDIHALIAEGQERIAHATQEYNERLANAAEEAQYVADIRRKLEELEQQKLLLVAELERVKRRGSAEQQLVERTQAIEGNVQAVARLIVERRTEVRSQKLYSVSASRLPREVRQTLADARPGKRGAESLCGQLFAIH
jgi:hypothetical protein